MNLVKTRLSGSQEWLGPESRFTLGTVIRYPALDLLLVYRERWSHHSNKKLKDDDHLSTKP